MSALHELTPSDPPFLDVISCIRFSPDGSRIAVGSWDGQIYIYEKAESQSIFELDKNFLLNKRPILDLCWDGEQEDALYSVGVDNRVRGVGIADNVDGSEVLSIHEGPSNKIAYSKEHGILLSTSWDETMHVHDPRSETRPYVRIKLADKPFAISLSDTRAVVAMANRKVSVYDLNALTQLIEQNGGTGSDQSLLELQPWQERESSLKFMTRAVACLNDGTGFATSSIEGRVGVEWFDPEEQSKTYAFKCHRESSKRTVTNPETGEEKEEDVDVIYPVNCLAFHPVHGTFATGGGDGVVAIWDAQTKRRVKQYHKLDESIVAMDFSPDGKYLAIGISPGFEDGKEDEKTDPGRVKLFIRELAENEAKGKEGKTKKKAAE